MVFEIEKIRSSTLLNEEEKEHLEAVNEIILITKEMKKTNGLFD